MKYLSGTVKTVLILTIFASIAFLGFYWSSTISADNIDPANSTPVVPGEPISAYADFYVTASDIAGPETGEFTTSVTSYEVVIDGTRYPAVVPADTRRKYSKLNIPIQGTLNKGTITLDEAPFKILDPSKFAEKGVDEKSLGDNGVASEVGGKVEYFQNRISFDARLRAEIDWESKIGAEKTSASEQENDFSPGWTEGTKKILFMRADFVDDPGGIVTEQQVLDTMNNHVNPFFVANSYNKTTVQTTVTPVLRLPHPRTYYQQPGNAPSVLDDARVVAAAAGYNPAEYQFDAVVLNHVPNMCGGGGASCGNVGIKGMWLSSFFPRVVAHELGHNYGMYHAWRWQSNSSYPIGPGIPIDYGDNYDVMGTADPPISHFNASYKGLLNWLTDGNVRTVVNDGTYRVYSHDNSNEGGIRALRIKKDDTKDYWISRRAATSNPNMTNGVQFHWRENSVSFLSYMLEMHGPNNTSTSPLLVGESFTDNEDHIKFSVLDDGSVPESVNVKLEFNVGCTFSLAQSSASFAASGGEGSIPVNTQAGCAPTATDDSKWIQVLESKKGAPNAALRYIVLPNYGAARTGTIKVAGLTFTVNQSAQAAACLASPGGLVAWWRGDGNVLDQSAKNHAPAVDLKKSFGGGKFGGAFRTVDVSNVYPDSFLPIALVPDSPSLALPGSFTIEGWVKTTSAPYASIIKRVDDVVVNHPSYAVDLSSGKIFFTINSNSNPGQSTSALVTTSVFPQNEFVHFAATLDSLTGSMKIYLNGAISQQLTTGVRPFQTLPNGGKIWLGDNSGTSDFSFDELSVYDRSLSTAEVQSIYNAGAGKCPLSVTDKTPFDFDGDRRSDLSIGNRAASQILWQSINSQTGASDFQFGLSTDKLVPADYDNDGKTDVAVYRNGWWYLQQSTAGFAAVQWGLSDDIPQPADFTGDGRAELVVFRPSNGVWYALNLVNFQYTGVQFGLSGDKPAVGDYDGDGVADYAVFRPSDGTWYLLRSTGGFYGIQFGIAADYTVAADYDGDGKTDIAVYREGTNSEWYILRSSDSGVTGKVFGHATDYPAPADFDGDGKTDIAVWQQGSGLKKGEWSITKSHNSQLIREYLGNPGDVSVPTAFTNYPY